MDPKGKVALVTGGAAGIGLAYVKELLQNGSNVVVCDIDAKAAEKSMEEIVNQFGKDRSFFIKMDVRNESEFEEAIKRTLHHFKKLDIIINNAGVFDESNWERVIDINLKGVLRGTMLAMKYLGRDANGTGGVLVNIASVLGLECCAVSPAYCAAKHGVVALSRCLGMPEHYTRTGLRIVTLCPSATKTTLQQTAHLNLQFHEWEQMMVDTMESLPLVQPEVVAKSLLHILQRAEAGSVWVSEGEETYPIEIPDRQTFRVKQ